MLKDLAGVIVELSGTKIKSIGWSMHYDIKRGIERTLEMLR